MKISNIKFLVIAAMSASIIGCKKGEDLYVNPNSPSEVTPALLLSAVEVATFNTFEGGLVKYPSILVQQNAGVSDQALQINNYTFTESDNDNQWGQCYQTLYNIQELETVAGDENPYYRGIGKVLAAMNWGILTDLWGDIPFSQALQAQGNYQPTYDSQEQVLAGIDSILNSAITDLSQDAASNTLTPASDDIALDGDVATWIKIAYTLKARYLNRLSNKTTYSPTAILAALGNGISSQSEDFVAIHGSTTSAANQWYDFQQNRQGYILASLPFVDSLYLRPTDVRINYYFEPDDSSGLVTGSPIDDPNPDASWWGTYLAGSSATPVHLVTYTEAKFIEAEVKMRQSDATGAATALNEAIQASCNLVTGGAYAGSDIAIYTSSNVSLSRIMYEKWLGMFGSGEGYNDYRRTGLPALTPNSAGHVDYIPKRLLTPQAERTANPNAPTPAISDAIWYAQ